MIMLMKNQLQLQQRLRFNLRLRLNLFNSRLPVQPAQPQVQAQPVQPTPAQPAVDNSAQNAATLKSNIEDQILEDLKKNNYSDVAIVRANRKYKELVKKGIMTQDEFNTKMHELLPTEEEPEEEAASDAENAESNE